jgi:hypothetical protein
MYSKLPKAGVSLDTGTGGEHRDQVCEALRGAQLRVLGPAARLEDLIEGFDLPPHRVPIEFLDSLFSRLNGKVSDEFPIYSLAIFRRVALLRADHGQGPIK